MDALLEREGELATIAGRLDDAVAGNGSLIVVEGPAGIGKTSVLAEAVRMAREREMTVLRARGGVLEQRLEFGIVRQLIERPVLRADDARRAQLLSGPAAGAAPILGLGGRTGDPTPGHDAMLDILHALHWVVANLAEERPLLLVVDDAQWGDAASLRAGGYLARRLTDLPVAFIVGIRADEPGRQAAIVAEQLRATEPIYLRLSPFSTEAVERILTGVLGKQPPADVVEACESASGGNPFYLTELVGHLAGDVADSGELSASAVAGAGPPAVRRSLLLRLGQLGDDAGRLARALATLGGEGELRHAAAVAGLDAEASARAVDTLTTAGIIDGGQPLRMTHSLVRAAINDEIAPSDLAAGHRRAYEVLAADGSADDAMVSHALEAEARGDEAVVGLLQRTAARALRTGSPDTAAVHLRRALAEPPTPELRGAVLAELGHAEVQEGSFPEGLSHLEGALATMSPEDERRLGAYRDQALAAFASAGMDDARSVVASALGDVGAEAGMQLEVDLALLAWLTGAQHGLDLDRHDVVAGATRAERTTLALLAQERLAAGAPAAEVVELATRALGGGRLISEDTGEAFSWYLAVYSLLVCEAFDPARETIADALGDGRARGSAFTVAGALGARAVLALGEGRPADAELDARTAAAGGIPPTMAQVNTAYLVMALVEQGDLEAAERELVTGGIESGPGGPTVLRWIPWGRARLREAQGSVEGVRSAIAPLEEDDRAGAPMRTLTWRALLARTLARARAGDSEATSLAAAHLGWASDWGRPAALGIAERASGLAAAGEERTSRLEAAAATLSGSALRTEEARARTDLGIALLRSGRRADGRAELEAAVELAVACGAKGTARTAAAELEVAGASPRKLLFDELTASERRVAEMAADGRTNREIGEELYISPKTVENHLTRVYSKLGVGSRKALAAAL